MPSNMPIEARSVRASATAEHAGTACQAKAAFSVMASRIIGHRRSHARTARHTISAFTANHMFKPCLMFGASVFMRHATGRDAQSQSGCLSCGSLLNSSQRQSATHHRQVIACPSAGNRDHAPRHLATRRLQAGRASFGARRAEVALPRLASIRQNLWQSIQGSTPMQKPSIHSHRQFGLFSSAMASVQRLTRRSSGRPLSASLRSGQAGAAYLGR
jgi:hypothetical protein